MRQLLLLTAFLILSKTIVCCRSVNADRQSTTGYLPVTRVVDGDTFWVDDGTNQGLKIRLIGIDAPESRKTGKKEIGYFGKQSKKYLANLLSGKKVTLKFDVARYDKYHRTLAYAYLEDGTFLNAELVKRGYAIIMTVPPNVKFAELFVKLAREARENNRGLWNSSF